MTRKTIHHVRNPLANILSFGHSAKHNAHHIKVIFMLAFTTSLTPSPVGEMMVVMDQDGLLRALEWTDLTDRMTRLFSRQYRGQPISYRESGDGAQIRDALQAYFAGTLSALDSLETQVGGTMFQQSVWRALRTIPAGQTRSYRDIAIAIGNPKGVRAIGLANGANPIGIVVPCHRVIGANGTMTGYGGGLNRKEWLLKHEGALIGALI
jgi:methylated-DNA-[protein]-cysteine S-methyltransferase